MGLTLRPGIKLNSAVCDTQIMVLRAPAGEVDIHCGGAPMSTDDVSEKGDVNSDLSGGTLVGKRYVDEGETMEFLCTRGGDGTIQVNGDALGVKQAKQLPSSD